jgi:hypothetical protein
MCAPSSSSVSVRAVMTFAHVKCTIYCDFSSGLFQYSKLSELLEPLSGDPGWRLDSWSRCEKEIYTSGGARAGNRGTHQLHA